MYKKPMPYRGGSLAPGKEIRGGEPEKADPESKILTRSPAHRQAIGGNFKRGFNGK